MTKLSPQARQEQIDMIHLVINKNKMIDTLKNELNKISKDRHWWTNIDNVADIISLIVRYAPDPESKSDLLTQYASENMKVGLEYLRLISDSALEPGKELTPILNHFTSDFTTTFNLIQDLGHILYMDVWTACSGWNRLYYSRYTSRDELKYKAVPITQSRIAYIEPYLNNIWNIYHEQLYQQSRRGPKLMFLLWLIFQERFTEDMFITLVKRLRTYKDDFMIQYVLKGSRIRLPKVWRDKMEAAYMILKMDNTNN